MLFFADVSIFAQPLPLRPAGAILMTQNFSEFSCFLVTIWDFEGSEQVFSITGSKIRAKKT